MSRTSEPASKRMAFVVEIARRLHQYGTAAARLEDAIDSVSARLQLNCHALSTPTSIVFSFTDRATGGALAELTQVIRVSPGHDDLANLCAVDEIAECVINGAIDIDEGFRRLHEIRDQPSALRHVLEILAYGIAGAAVAAILNCGWVDLVAAFGIGVVVGVVAAISESRPQLQPSVEALSTSGRPHSRTSMSGSAASPTRKGRITARKMCRAEIEVAWSRPAAPGMSVCRRRPRPT